MIYTNESQTSYSVLDLGYDRTLTKIVRKPAVLEDTTPELSNVFTSGVAPKNVTAGELVSTLEQQAGVLFSGKTGFNNTQTGYRLGVDSSDGLMKFYLGNTTEYINWNGTDLTIVGGLSVDSIDIGGSDSTSFHVSTAGNMWLGSSAYSSAPFRVTSTGDLDIGGTDATSFHIDNAGNLWWGSAGTYAAASVKISNAGVAAFSDITITGGAISGTPISSIPNNSSTDISLLMLTHSLVFSVTDADTIAWSSGTISLSNGRTFSIDAGNTGNMTALTYIYIDPDVSSTVLQTTTTYATAVGANKVLLGTAQNQTVTASFIPFHGGLPLIDGAQIGALSIVAGNIAATTITAAKMNVSQLSAIAADLGTITAGTVTGATIRTAASGDRFTMDSTSFQAIEAGGNVIFEVVLSGGDAGDVIMGDDATSTYAKWDDSAATFTVNGYVVVTKGVFGGDGSDGAFSQSSGTTTLSMASASVLVKNYTSFSLTGTADLTVSNKVSTGAFLIIKTTGNFTATSSTSPAINLASMGGNNGTGGAADTDGTAGTTGLGNISVNTAGAKGTKGVNPSTQGTGGTAGAGASYTSLGQVVGWVVPVWCGAGGAGGGGGADNGSGGDGGKGGGVLIIECAGAYNVSSTFSCGGANGSAATGGTTRSGGGGGGGGGGTIIAGYKTLTSDTGTYTVSAGTGGSGQSIASSVNGGGGGGGAGSSPTAATAGQNGQADKGGAGGDGAAGFSMRFVNNSFA